MLHVFSFEVCFFFLPLSKIQCVNVLWQAKGTIIFLISGLLPAELPILWNYKYN